MSANPPCLPPGAANVLPSAASMPTLSPPRQVDAGRAPAVATALLAYLQRRLSIRDLRYAARPTPVSDGWETYIYTFRLAADRLPPEWDRPLVVRIHVTCTGLKRARHEFAVPQLLVQRGYPVPEPMLKEEACDVFGGPFLIMTQVVGTPLLRALVAQPWNLLYFAGHKGELHARLHALPSAGLPARLGPGLARRFAAMRTAIAQVGLAGLTPGLDWLEAHQPAEPEVPCILHLDYHPLNLIVRPDSSLAVLDWTYADLGDPHLDVGTTLMMLEAIPIAADSAWAWLAMRVGRPVLTQWYLHSYQRRHALDPDRLNYYRAWAALHQLVRYGRWLRAGPEAYDCKASATEHLSPAVLDAVARYFRRWSGVAVRL